MGIGIVELNFLNYCKIPLGAVLTIGRQEFHLPKSFKLQGFGEEYLLKLGASSVSSIDFDDYEGSTLEIDLSKPIGNDFNKRFDTILDFGSLEHISNPIIAIENYLNLLSPRGTILHSNPANGSLGHGFYQFSPEFYQSIYFSSGMTETIDTYLVNRKKPRTIFKVKQVVRGRRANIRFEKSNIYNLVCVRKIDSNKVVHGLNFQQLDYLERYENHNSLNTNQSIRFLNTLKGKVVDFVNLRKSKLNERNSDLIQIKIKKFVRP